MPESTDTQQVPPIPDWVSWDEDQSTEYVTDVANRCDYCGEIYFVRAMTPSRLPAFIANDETLSAEIWVTPTLGRHPSDDEPLVRWSHLSRYTFQEDYSRDCSYDALDEHYDYLCSGCEENRSEANYEAEESNNEDSSEYVHDYSYRPRTAFFFKSDVGVDYMRAPNLSEAGRRGVLSPASYDGATPVQEPYFGFELEMTRNDSSMSVNDAAQYLYNKTDQFAYMKWDGSVERGFELVTHPHTLEAYNHRTQLWDALDFLRSRGWRSWNSTSSCGLHIHINNASFSSVGHAMRFLMFVYKNPEPLVRFAGRDSSYARFNFDQFVQREVHVGWNEDGSAKFAVGTVADVVKKKQANDSRYLAVNCQNTHTYELRFFRGNMNPNAVRACLEFVAALHEYTENLTSHDCLVNRALTWRPFLAFVRRKSGEENFRYRRLHERLTMSTRNGDSGFINTAGAE